MPLDATAASARVEREEQALSLIYCLNHAIISDSSIELSKVSSVTLWRFNVNSGEGRVAGIG